MSVSQDVSAEGAGDAALGPTRSERDVTASGVRLRVVEDGSGPAIVLIHGLFMDHRTWDPVRAALNAEFRVITPDLPGFGQSEKPPPSRFPYGIDAFTEAVADLYAGLELGRAVLVGHGLGASVALTLAARHSELVSRLVLLAPWIHPERPVIENRLAKLPLFGSLLFRQMVGRGTFRTYFRERIFSQRSAERIDPSRIDAFYESFNSPAARGSALATLRSLADTRAVMAQTSRIQTPTLVICGHDDPLCDGRFGQRLSREIRGSHFELLDSGHAPQEERPADVARLIRRFVAR